MANEEKVLIGEKEFTREELLAFGKCHYPKFYWIPRGIGIGFMATGFIAISIVLLFAFINNDFFNKSDKINWMIWIQVGIYAIIALGGVISYIASFSKQPDENYIKHAVDYYTKQDLNIKAREKRLADRKEKQEVAQLLKYKKLCDSGVITKEEYENKKKEILGE